MAEEIMEQFDEDAVALCVSFSSVFLPRARFRVSRSACTVCDGMQSMVNDALNIGTCAAAR
jgi:hypothetical protein